MTVLKCLYFTFAVKLPSQTRTIKQSLHLLAAVSIPDCFATTSKIPKVQVTKLVYTDTSKARDMLWMIWINISIMMNCKQNDTDCADLISNSGKSSTLQGPKLQMITSPVTGKN